MKWSAVISLSFSLLALRAQNVIEDRAAGPTAPPIQISETQVVALVNFQFATPPSRRNAEAQRIARKLDRHVNEFLDGWPWMPFQQTLGISGYEIYFDHPDEMFYALSLALPVLATNTA